MSPDKDTQTPRNKNPTIFETAYQKKKVAKAGMYFDSYLHHPHGSIVCGVMGE